ncbi:MAG: YbaK/EbsC family protein [Bacteroidetes bacterium]|nr:YbaK/EbsC family protein [Bacteroidota bacterium]
MILTRLTDFLDGHKLKYVLIQHSPAFTAREVAVTAHIPFHELAKTVVLTVDDAHMLAILPATEMVNLAFLRDALKTPAVHLTNESEFNALFPDCEVGAMPPFGNLFDMKVIVSASLAEDEEIAFNAGSHRDLIKMAYEDFDRLVRPRVLPFSTERHARPNPFTRGLS